MMNSRMRLLFTLVFYGGFAVILMGIISAGITQPTKAASTTPKSASTVLDATSALEAPAEIEPPKGMTLYDLLKSGGWVMIVLGLLSILMLALAIHFAVTLRVNKMLPGELVNQVRSYLRSDRYEDIARLCRRSKGMFAKIVLAGLTRGVTDPSTVAATMEAVGRREAEFILRRVRYLSDIATVSPMLGLLGTVFGMINAFNFVAFEISIAKPVALAGSVAQALVTTAAGLIVAIPSMSLFFYFRGKVQNVIGKIEEVAMEIADHMVALGKKENREPEVAPIAPVKRTKKVERSLD